MEVPKFESMKNNKQQKERKCLKTESFLLFIETFFNKNEANFPKDFFSINGISKKVYYSEWRTKNSIVS